jgi:hypothetical protein
MQIPHGWLKVLKDLEDAGFHGAFIAGGALRDLMHDRPIKDVDIFLNPRGLNDELYAVQEAVPDHSVRPLDHWNTDYNILSDHPVKLVFDLAKKSYTELEPPFQVIIHQQPASIADVLDRFDFGICQIAVGVDTEVITTSAYRQDARDQTFTMRPCRDDATKRYASYIRWLRLAGTGNAKYAGWELEGYNPAIS